jgi:rRNA maturation endonuclease Nob1
MTTEVKQQSFEELYNQSLKKNPDLFNIKREMEEVALGRFICYACTQTFPLSKKMTIRHRDFCPDCYKIVKTEPRAKDKGDDE